MMLNNKIILPIIAILTVSACSSRVKNPIDPDLLLNNPKKAFNSDYVPLEDAYISSVKSFSQDFYHTVMDNENQVFSPLSIAACYSMLLDGAKGETRKELEDLLHYDGSFDHLKEVKNMLLNNAINDEKNSLYLDISQSFWVDDTFKPDIDKDYVKILESYYFAEALCGDLESDLMHETLANWINNKTKNFLNVKKEDFQDYGGVLWLLNTIYLKTQWSNPFPEAQNTLESFNNLDKSTTEMTFMNKVESGSYYASDNFVISSLPMQGNFTLNILLPNEGTNYMKVLNDKTAMSALINYYNTRNHMPAEISFKYPQFKMQKSLELTSILKNMGVNRAFDTLLADLSGIYAPNTEHDLFVKKSKHEAGIEFKNEGVEAAAYTIIEVSEKASMPVSSANKIKFYVDRPFSYLINTMDGLPLFMGVVTNMNSL